MNSPSGSMSALRTVNRSRVLRSIAQHHAISRTSLADVTGLTPPSVTRIVRELVELGLVMEGEESSSREGPGRRRTDVSVNPAGAYVLGFVLSASGKSVALADANGEIIAEKRVSEKNRDKPAVILRALADAAHALCASHLSDNRRLLGATIVCAGEVDVIRGHLNESMALGWQDVAIGQLLGASLDVPLYVDNINVSILEATQIDDHEHLVADSMLVRIANGLIGGAIMQGGRLLRSPNSRPSWIGHHPIRGGRRRCFCGEIGCLNTEASAPAMLSALAGGKSSAQLSSTDFAETEAPVRQLIKSADQGDRQAIKVLRAGGRQLGRFLVAHAGSFGPELIHIAGFVGRSRYYFEGAQEGFESKAPKAMKAITRLVANDTSSEQAAVNVSLDRFLYSPQLNIDRLPRDKASNAAGRQSMNAA